MAITTTTISISAGWARTDVIRQLEQAATWLGFNGSTQTGLVIGIATFNGGGTVAGSNADYYDVFQSSTTGIGTGASFFVDRNSGPVSQVIVNRPGYGYTGGEIITISSEDIGGVANGAANLTLKVVIDGTVTGGVGYAVSFVTGSNYVALGSDRNGVVSGANTTITITEGDTLTITNYNTTTSYYTNICWKDDSTADNTNRVFNVVNQNATGGASGGISTWRSLPGQAGTYFIKDDNGSNLTTTKIVVTPATFANVNPTGYGSTITFFDKNITAGSTYPWGVMRHQIQANKKFGNTFRGFQVISNTDLRLHVGSGFVPFNTSGSDSNRYTFDSSSPYGGSVATSRRFVGNESLDIPYNFYSGAPYFYVSSNSHNEYYQDNITFSSSTSYQLDLNIFRSGIDPRFAVLSYRHPTLSSLRLTDNTYATFILHNFTTSVWDLDNLFLGGYTRIVPSTNTGDPHIQFATEMTGEHYNYYTRTPSKRCAEYGYIQHDPSGGYSHMSAFKSAYYRSNSYPYAGGGDSVGVYVRSNAGTSSRGNSTSGDYLPSSTNFNAVIKGIPLNPLLSPCPYYIPDDFVLIDFDFASPSANIQQGDTITVSGSEVYTVIVGSYNQTTRTRGILFCARIV